MPRWVGKILWLGVMPVGVLLALQSLPFFVDEATDTWVRFGVLLFLAVALAAVKQWAKVRFGPSDEGPRDDKAKTP